MAFSDPQSITVGSDTFSLARTSSGLNSGQFTQDDQSHQLNVSSSYNKNRARRTARIDVKEIVADPLNPTRNNPASMSVYIVLDAPLEGFTVADQKATVLALTSWLTASTGANTAKLIGGEN